MLISFNYALFHLFVIILQMVWKWLDPYYARLPQNSSICIFIYSLWIKLAHDATAFLLRPACEGVNDKNGKIGELIGSRLLETR